MKTIRIGRSSKNDFVLENQTVSGSHAILTLSSDGQSAKLKDLNSTNGTYINNNPHKITEEVSVSLNDTIKFGSECITLREILLKMNKTKVQVIGSGTPYLHKKTIGKNADNDIVLPHDDVSRKHAILFMDKAGNVIIEDSGSTNGTYVNGIKITSQVLKPGDEVSITRNYPLNWQNYFKPKVQAVPNKPVKQNTTIFYALGALTVAMIVGVYCYLNWPWSKEKIYKEYNSAVCWVLGSYGYKVYLDGEDFTSSFCEFLSLPENGLIHLENTNVAAGGQMQEGTAFFITEDGKLATNLHITRPWLFNKDKESIERIANKLIALLATKNPVLARSVIEVKGIMNKLYVIPNGLPLSESNMIECSEIKGYDSTDRDVAVMQTVSREVPAKVSRIIDINNADNSDEALIEGKTIFTIGYPYGSNIAFNSNMELRNQVHAGSITQNRGEFEFGHDAATASGASGSPILNEQGRLIGVHHAGLTGATGAQGFNMAIKVKYVIDLLK